ncbi:two-component system, cell cycle sensor histidine kinase and response regulator CckA [Yoonia rosea]|uniref:histidine kinase n=2 Tax=Yoonia rosea TaxID=287098 RepID=A0A1R3WLB4_9RHOB|nr:ATP-binding protein [Yoonia rosea]SIT77423.1 two-component system, cell cycle sensor histidine kinase and response regulator CckA [Yoonia rosea]
MPFDQSFTAERPKVPAGLPPVLHLFVAGCLCFAVAVLMPVPALYFGFAICGGILVVTAGFVGVALKLDQRAAHRLRAMAHTIIAHDTGIGFVTDGTGLIRYANAGAHDRFGATEGTGLAQVLGAMLANPYSVLSQIIAQAGPTGAKTEDIVTRGGHFRLRLLIMGEACQIWWLDDLSVAGRAGRARPQPATFPMLTVGPSGQVIQMNESFRKLVGPSFRTLEDVFDELPLRSGQPQVLRGLQGRKDVVLAITEGSDETRDIYVLPGAPISATPPMFEPGWDAIENLPVPLMKIAPDGVLLATNREARQLLNIGATRGRHVADVLDGPGRPINDWLGEALAGQAGHVSQFLHGRGDKQDTFVQVTLNTAGSPDDLHVIAVLNDITELKTLEAQFVQSQKMQAIGQLAGGVAHDFNNLLTAISGHCELLLCNHDEHDRDYSDLIQIHQNTNRAASLVGQLLAFSRKQTLQPEALDLRDTLSDLTHLLNRLVGEKVSLKLEHDNQLARIKADKRQLEQVLMNLVVNARDAMQGAGEIRVVTKNTHLKTALHRDRATVPPGDYVLVKVIDEGHGIPSDKLEKIFEPFVTTKRVGEGTGLGLSTAYGIVKQSGGYIFVDSEVGVGATFSLLFPSHTPTEEVAEPVAPVASLPIKTSADGVVLLVEDEAPVRAFAARALRLRGYTVLEADCAEAALELLENAELHIDIFVTDVIMPGQDGPTWVRKALLQRPQTRVVFVSGYPEDAFDDGQPEVLGAAFLPKPFSLKALTDTVQEQLQGSPTLEQA